MGMIAAGEPGTPGGLLRKLAQSGDPLVIERVARNPGAPANLLEALGEKLWVPQLEPAENPSCPAALLDGLGQSLDNRLRARVAGNPACPVDRLCQLMPVAEVFC